jgi:hypothetical protein
MSNEKPQRVTITGAWERNGSYGPFYTGNVKKSEFLELVKNMDGENLQILVSSVSEDQKKSDRHPDILVSMMVDNYKKNG